MYESLVPRRAYGKLVGEVADVEKRCRAFCKARWELKPGLATRDQVVKTIWWKGTFCITETSISSVAYGLRFCILQKKVPVVGRSF